MRELEATLGELLPAFLPRQRWFGGKAKQIVSCDVCDAAEVEPDGRSVLVVVRVSFDDASRQQYGMVVARRADDPGGRAIGPWPGADGGWIVDAAADASVADDLIAGFARGQDVATRAGGVVRYGDVTEEARRLIGAGSLGVAPVGAEQSNTSLRLGRSFIFKLFRRVESGENPELEVGRFLATRTRFRATSSLEGSLTYVPPEGGAMTLGVLQGWIESRGDGWSYVLQSLNDGVRTGQVPAQLLHDVALLGRITADFHAALGSDDRTDAFAPVPVAGADLAAWSAAVRHSASRVFGVIAQRAHDWPDETRELAEAAIAHGARIADVAPNDAAAPASPFSKIRIHGDYHLGQTLKTGDGFAIIDFEGEPAVPIERRRQKLCALKDVAGMLRSFDYAIESACEGRPDDAGRLRSMVDLRGPFLHAYLHSATRQANVSVPSDHDTLMRWLTLFELEKALYEFEYELNNRPAWIYIPLRGILRALSAA